MKLYTVLFDAGSLVVLAGDTEAAGLSARLLAWHATGQWLQVLAVVEGIV